MNNTTDAVTLINQLLEALTTLIFTFVSDVLLNIADLLNLLLPF